MRPFQQFPTVHEQRCEIESGPNGMFELYIAGEDFPVRVDPSPRWLSRCALDSGAIEVKWDFDLQLAGDR